MKSRRTPPPQDLFSIGDVAEATGISTETLRIWERRYGRPEPVRLPSGHRRYTADHIRWLRRVAEALAHGHRPHKVVPLDEPALDELLAPLATEVGEPADELDAVLEMVRGFQAAPLVRHLRGAWDPKAPVDFVDGHIAPLVQAVGRAWADGKIDIRHEHFGSEVVQDVLRSLRAELTNGVKHEPRVLLTTLTGERHGLGLQMAALICAGESVPFRILGTDTPNEEIARAAQELEVDVVGISVSLATGGVETDRLIAGLRSLLPDDIRLVVGGAGARGVRRGPRDVEYASTLEAWSDLVREIPAS